VKEVEGGGEGLRRSGRVENGNRALGKVEDSERDNLRQPKLEKRKEIKGKSRGKHEEGERIHRCLAFFAH
jgi:hypothetical protein